MSLQQETLDAVKRLNRVTTELKLLFARRDTAIDLMRLALLCREHVLLLGPPGTAKSELVNRFGQGVQARSFHYLLTRFTEPAELFGPMDLQEFEQGSYRIRTEGMLPGAQIAFLDEVFQASSAILNTLLSLIHERVFHNGSELQQVPLITLFGASNLLPDDPTLHAFSDRFVLRLEVDPVPDESLSDLLDKGWDMEAERLDQQPDSGSGLVTPEHLDHLFSRLPQISVTEVQPQYQELIRRLRAEGVELSDRRLVKGLKLIRGAALLDSRDQADVRDLWPLNHIWSSPDDRAVLHEVIQPLVDEAGGPSLVTHRPLEDLREEFELLASRAEGLRGDGAFTAHLSALAQIRRELLLYHPDERDLLERVQGVISGVMEGMQEVR
ncbi:MAG: AAA domain-containing protein [Planctomycetes bacterium]|nr:AAA domain-containing protein [Planctomycetota bacterium]